MSLPALPPDVAAALIDALPSRLKRRAGALAAECSAWPIDGDRITVGDHVVTVSDTLTCDCLLSPKCAHVGAVALAAPVADAPAADAVAAGESAVAPPETVPAEAAGAPAEDDPSTVSPVAPPITDPPGADAPATPDRVIAAAELEHRRDLAERSRRLVDVILERGIGALGVADHAAGLALLQSARAAALPRLERALTGVVGASRSMRTLAPPGRDDLARRVGALATAAHALAENPGSDDAVGQARRTYSALDGRGTGTFVPVCAEPVVAASGFAGVVLTFADARGELLEFAHTPPGDASDVPAAWLGRAALGDLHCSHAELARHRLLISGGRTSADGRLGRGRGVRAALGAPVTPEDLRGIDAYRVFEGTVESADRRGFAVTEPSGGTLELRFSTDARRAGLGGVVAWLRSQTSVTVVADGDKAVRLWGDGGEQVFPGLDRPKVDDAVVGAVVGPVERGLVAPAAGVAQMLADWSGLAVAGGATAIRARERRVLADAARLDDLAAPVAAELLRGLLESTDATAIARIHVYLGR